MKLSDIPITSSDPYFAKTLQIYNQLDRIYDDFTANTTYIFGRNDLHFSLDLAYHSILNFEFLAQDIRGWVQVICVGDTRTGKSTLVRRMMKNYGYGELLTGENVSFAGLVGGIDEANSMRYVHWGTYPQNDRGLVIIDEVQEASQDIITRLSNVRSAGIAEIKKIRSMSTYARVRSFWIANPRHNMQLEHFDCGVESLMNIIGKPEDIARFDVAISAGLNDVDREIYSFKRKDLPRIDHTFTQNLNRKLLRWCWSRRAENVSIPEDVEDVIVDYATSLSEDYSQKIPLVIYAEQKNKVARLAVSLAARLFSTDDDRSTVCVKAEHAAAVYYYLQSIYKKESMRYYDFSQRKKLHSDYVIGSMSKYGKKIIRTLLQYSAMNQGLCSGMLRDSQDGRALWSWLLTSGCLEQTPKGTGLRKTTEFASLLRKMSNDSGLPEEHGDLDSNVESVPF